MKRIKYIYLFSLLLSTSTYAVDDRVPLRGTGFEASLPEGVYLYKTTPNLEQNVFTPLWIVKDKRLTDPTPLFKGNGAMFQKNYLDGQVFDVLSGVTLVGTYSNVRYQIKSVCGAHGFQEYPNVVGVYQGAKLQPYVADSKQWGQTRRYVHTSSRLIAAPHVAVQPWVGAYQQPTEQDKVQALNQVSHELAAGLRQQVSTWMVRKWGKKYTVTADKGGYIGILEKTDIDHNGLPDLVGVYEFTLQYGKGDEVGEFYSSVLFTLLNGRELKQHDLNYAQKGFRVIAISDITGDGVAEIIYLKNMFLEQEGGEGGRQIRVLHLEQNTWREAYRSASSCNNDPGQY